MMSDVLEDKKMSRSFKNMLDHLMNAIYEGKINLRQAQAHILLQDSKSVLSLFDTIADFQIKDMEKFYRSSEALCLKRTAKNMMKICNHTSVNC